jgi:hypothetical protein
MRVTTACDSSPFAVDRTLRRSVVLFAWTTPRVAGQKPAIMPTVWAEVSHHHPSSSSSLRSPVIPWYAKIYQAWRRARTPVVLPIVLIIVGTVAIVLGEGASKAFAAIGGAVILRIMGGTLVVGGALVVSSIVANSLLREVMGLVFLALGTSIYSGGAILGLGSQGLVSGVGYAGITLTLLSRVVFILHSATEQEHRH